MIQVDSRMPCAVCYRKRELWHLILCTLKQSDYHYENVLVCKDNIDCEKIGQTFGGYDRIGNPVFGVFQNHDVTRRLADARPRTGWEMD